MAKNTLHHPLRLAITMGDPVGIGPEIILKVITQPEQLPRT
jgi:4-hydroxy-L-threonine phosphate dehydrogenase PdxA